MTAKKKTYYPVLHKFQFVKSKLLFKKKKETWRKNSNKK